MMKILINKCTSLFLSINLLVVYIIMTQEVKKALIIKGFARDFDMNNLTHRKAAESVIKMAENYDIIAWDGDKYKTGSFTEVIQQIIKNYPEKTYRAFRKNDNINLKYVYNKEKVEIKTEKIPNIPEKNYLTLGKRAFETLRNAYLNVNVVFLGLGKVSSEEHDWLKIAQKRPNKIILHPLSRKTDIN